MHTFLPPVLFTLAGLILLGILAAVFFRAFNPRPATPAEGTSIAEYAYVGSGIAAAAAVIFAFMLLFSH